MLKKLSIRNYGPVKRLDVDLNSGITCFCGESYEGKSYILRALRWLALNKPHGMRYIRWGAKQASVRIKTDKHAITRKRSTTVNTYAINGRLLKSLPRTGVPAIVKKVLNLGELNFQKQQELPPGDGPLFWFALTAGQVSKELNKIVDLEIIDSTLANLKQQNTRARHNKELCKEHYNTAVADKTSLSFVPKLVNNWQGIKQLSDKIAVATKELTDVRHLVVQIKQHKRTMQKIDLDVRVCKTVLIKLLQLRETIINKENIVNELAEAVIQIQQQHACIKRLKYECSDLKQKYDIIMQDRCPLCGTKKKIKVK